MQAFVTEMTVWPETEPWYQTAAVRVSLTERHVVSQVNGGKPEEAFVKTKQDMLVALCADWNRNRSHTEGHVPTFHCKISSHLPRAVELTVVFVFTVKMRHAFEPSLVYVGTQFAEDLEGEPWTNHPEGIPDVELWGEETLASSDSKDVSKDKPRGHWNHLSSYIDREDIDLPISGRKVTSSVQMGLLHVQQRPKRSSTTRTRRKPASGTLVAGRAHNDRRS